MSEMALILESIGTFEAVGLVICYCESYSALHLVYLIDVQNAFFPSLDSLALLGRLIE